MDRPPDPASSNQDRHAEHWLAQLRDGSPAQKAEARSQLAAIFEARGMTSEAVELLVANARGGYRTAELFETLARLYRSLGNEYLAASAALEAARLRERGPTMPRPTAPPPPNTERAASLPPGPLGPTAYGQAGPFGQTGPSGRPSPRRGPGGPPPSNGPQPAGRRWEPPLRAGGWVVFAGTVIGALAVAGTSPVAAVAYAVAAGALGLLLAGAPGLRQLLRVPRGPLGNGVLIFVALLLFLVGGALLPHTSEPPPATAPPVRTPGPLYLGTPTPQSGIAPTAPAQGAGATPRPSPAASPDAASQSTLPPGTGLPGQIASAPTPPGASAAAPGTVPSSPPSPTSVPSTILTADAGARVRIANVGSEGVRLRPEPGSPEILKVLPEGTLLESMGEEQEDDGRQWRRVREPEGLVGWVATDFLATEPVTPTVVAAAPTATPVSVAAAVPPTQPPPPSQTPQPPPTSQPQPPAATVPPAAVAAQPTTAAVSATKPQAAPTAARPAPAATARPPAVAQAKPSGYNCPPGQPIKGNHSSSGEWIYHVPGGQSYSRTIPEECFATADEARRAGYRPSQR